MAYRQQTDLTIQLEPDESNTEYRYCLDGLIYSLMLAEMYGGTQPGILARIEEVAADLAYMLFKKWIEVVYEEA